MRVGLNLMRSENLGLARLLRLLVSFAAVLLVICACEFKDTESEPSGVDGQMSAETATELRQSAVTAELVTPGEIAALQPQDFPAEQLAFLDKYSSEQLSLMTEAQASDLLSEHGVPANLESLMQAAFYGRTALMSLLIAAGVDVNVENSERFRAIHSALVGRQEAAAELLYKHGAELRYAFAEDMTVNLIFFVINNNSAEMIPWLLEHGYETGSQTDDGVTALMHTCAVDSPFAAELLLQHGADVNAKTSTGNTALHFTAYSGSLKLINWLVEHGADLEAQEDEFGLTPLGFMVKVYNPRPAEELIKLGADFSVRRRNGDNLLQNVASAGDLRFVKLFLECGLDPNEPSNVNGLTSTQMVALSEKPDTLALILDAGGDPWRTNDDGKTALEVLSARLEEPAVQEVQSRVDGIQRCIELLDETMRDGSEI